MILIETPAEILFSPTQESVTKWLEYLSELPDSPEKAQAIKDAELVLATLK
jgi:hypothetical protein